MSTGPQALIALVEALTPEQREKLRAFGVDKTVLSRWKSGARYPTEVQTEYLAALTGIDARALTMAIVEHKATPEQRKLLRDALGKLRRGAGVMLSFGAGAAVAFAAAYERVATMYRGKNG